MSDEKIVINSISKMLSNPDYLYPFVSAQRQYRDHYYGLTAAALLEYFFIDMFAYHLSMFDSKRDFKTPSHGQREWDYKLDDVEISHKVGEKISAISGLWDATWTPKDGVYSFNTSIIYSIVNYTDKWGKLTLNDKVFDVTGLNQISGGLISPKQRLLICKRIDSNNWVILEEIVNESNAEQSISNLVSFKDIWQKYQELLNNSANTIEVFVLKNNLVTESLSSLKDLNVEIVFKFLPGFYLLDKNSLQNIEVTSNNRSNVLMPVNTVKEKMAEAAVNGYFAYMPTLFSVFSVSKPPDLYLSQKKYYDDLHRVVQQR